MSSLKPGQTQLDGRARQRQLSRARQPDTMFETLTTGWVLRAEIFGACAGIAYAIGRDVGYMVEKYSTVVDPTMSDMVDAAERQELAEREAAASLLQAVARARWGFEPASWRRARLDALAEMEEARSSTSTSKQPPARRTKRRSRQFSWASTASTASSTASSIDSRPSWDSTPHRSRPIVLRGAAEWRNEHRAWDEPWRRDEELNYGRDGLTEWQHTHANLVESGAVPDGLMSELDRFYNKKSERMGNRLLRRERTRHQPGYVEARSLTHKEENGKRASSVLFSMYPGGGTRRSSSSTSSSTPHQTKAPSSTTSSSLSAFSNAHTTPARPSANKRRGERRPSCDSCSSSAAESADEVLPRFAATASPSVFPRVVTTTRLIVRETAELESAKKRELPTGTALVILDRLEIESQSSPAASSTVVVRAKVALESFPRGVSVEPVGWVTAVKDGLARLEERPSNS